MGKDHTTVGKEGKSKDPWQARATGGLNSKLMFTLSFNVLALAMVIAVSPTRLLDILGGPTHCSYVSCAKCCIVHVGLIIYCILRVTLYRTTSEQDIDGSGLTQPSTEIRVLSALLQNTFEQSSLAILVYAIWAITMPSNYQGAIPLSAALFLVGRILFYSGYRDGSRGRAVGFALTFCPTINLFVVLIGKLLFDTYRG